MNWKSFWRGFGSAFDLFGSSNRRVARRPIKPMTAEEAWRADGKSIAGDWRKVGSDLASAMSKAKNEKLTKK